MGRSTDAERPTRRIAAARNVKHASATTNGAPDLLPSARGSHAPGTQCGTTVAAHAAARTARSIERMRDGFDTANGLDSRAFSIACANACTNTNADTDTTKSRAGSQRRRRQRTRHWCCPAIFVRQ